MRYIVAEVTRPGATTPLGYAAVDTTSDKLTSINLFTHGEANAEADRQNEAVAIKDHWPEKDDPDVARISTEFRLDQSISTAYALHRASEIVARQRAGLPEAS